jgi:acetone carboxylase gamma subunit
MTYLSRRIKANTGGAGRHRGGSSFESLLVVHGTQFWELQNLGSTRILASGIFGGYPGSASYVHNIKGADLLERARRGEAYPLCDGSFDDPALMEIQGERTYKQDNFTTLEPFAEGDLYLSVMKGGPGLGDPLLRPVERVERDVEEGHLLPRFAESIYGVSDRDALRRRRLERGRPAREWWAAERERVLAGDVIDAVKVGYAESMKLSERFAAEFRGFWDLPEDFTFDIDTPTVPADVTAKAGKITPEESADAYLAASKVDYVEMPRAGGGRLDRETLAAMLDEKLTRREIKAIQSGYKDPDRFDKWLAVLQELVPYGDSIVLPMGEGLNCVRVGNSAAPGREAEEAAGSGSQLVVRCDCGHDFCPPSRNWKMEALVFVRDDAETMGEVYPGFAGPDTDWSELREFYCPSCARQLEVEAVPPGYPVLHEFLPDIEGFYRGWLGRELP